MAAQGREHLPTRGKSAGKVNGRRQDVGMIAASSASRPISTFFQEARISRERILIVQEEKETCGVLREYLEDKGYEVAIAGSGALTEQAWRNRRPDIAVLDYTLPDGNAVGLIPRLKQIDASIPIIVLSGYGSIDLAVEAVKLGAEIFLPKPAELSTLYVVIQRCLETQRSHRRQLAENRRNSRGILNPFLGTSDSIRKLADQAQKVVSSENPVLIRGEAGAGKGNVAQWLHRNGPRAPEPFVDLNCTELSAELNTDLLGDDHNDFAGTLQRRTGLLEIAHKGTVFLDEIENADSQIQSQLLKLIDQKQFRGLGEVYDRRLDIRLIAATEQVVAPAVLRKQFRGDLHYRINWIALSVPPLRERIEDIPFLSSYILGELTADLGTGVVELGEVALRALQRYSWPGNIRELRNVLERVVLVSGKDILIDRHFRFDMLIEQYLLGIGQFRTLEEMERNYIEQVLRKERGRVQSAAKKLGIPRSSLYHKLKQYKADQSGLQSVS
jgi:DNA-binding NtrC family response regulator